MGVGTPADLLAAIAMGFDMFDCVLPTRNARNGCAFTSQGRISIKQAAHARDSAPLDPACECRPCRTHSRAYLRHLYLSGEILAARALTEHNLHFYASLMRQSQAAIASGNFKAYATVASAGWGNDDNAEPVEEFFQET
jgi:queuine tRNA-ribosyltransferase